MAAPNDRPRSDGEEGGPTTPAPFPAISRFTEACHSSFVARHGDWGPVTLTLEEVTVDGSRPGWESFSLIFDGPNPPTFADGLCEVEHADLGSFDLFLVAVHTDGDSQQYQAVFNRPST